jgi:hypothetical protein
MWFTLNKYMKKILISAIVILTLLVVFTTLYNYQKNEGTVVIPLPVATSTSPVSANNIIEVNTPVGLVAIADIRALPETKDVGGGMYHIDGTQVNPDAGFAILYSTRDNSFSIAIEKKPISTYRDKASQYFLELFHVSELDACKLKVLVGVPAEVDQNLAGQNLGLSFCPDSVKLP